MKKQAHPTPAVQKFVEYLPSQEVAKQATTAAPAVESWQNHRFRILTTKKHRKPKFSMLLELVV